MLFLETHKSYTHTVNRFALDDDIHVYIENQTMDSTSDISLLASLLGLAKIFGEKVRNPTVGIE